MKLALSSIILLVVFVIYGRTNPDVINIVNLHNNVRASVSPTASNMMALEWSDCLASVARDYLNSCPGFNHNPNRTTDAQQKGCLTNISPAYVGENVYVASYLADYAQAINFWADEEQFYDYDQNSCTKSCSHYTQIVWATTTQVGCAKKDQTECGGNGILIICNYAPGGNYNGLLPYKQGNPCDDCPTGYQQCNNNLCTV